MDTIATNTRPRSASLDSLVECVGVLPWRELLGEILQRVAAELDVELVSYWMLADDGKSMLCALQHEKSSGSTGQVERCLNEEDEPESFEMLHDPAETARFHDRVMDSLVHRNGRSFGLLRCEHAGGAREWSAGDADVAGRAAQWIALAVEIDLRQQAETSLRKSEASYRILIEYTPVATLIVDVETGRFVEANWSAVALYGRDRGELLSIGLADVSPEFQPDGVRSEEMVREAMHRALSGYHPRFDWMHLGADGREIPCSIYLARLPGRTGNRVIVTVTDRTDQLRAEQSMLRTLENEREVNELRSRFTAIVSHEFRTPLGIIMSAIELLDRYHDRLDAGKRAELLQDVRDSTRQMASLMEQVLVLGKAEAGKLSYTPEPVDLQQLCEKLTDESQSATVQRCPVRISFDGDLGGARADESLMRHIFSNLLSNASKYSTPGSPVDFLIRRDGGDAVFEVADLGIGIPLEDQGKLFEAFQRAGNVGDRPGTGLGLLIVRRCVTLHDGSVTFDSRPGEGTRFVVRLPLFA